MLPVGKPTGVERAKRHNLWWPMAQLYDPLERDISVTRDGGSSTTEGRAVHVANLNDVFFTAWVTVSNPSDPSCTAFVAVFCV